MQLGITNTSRPTMKDYLYAFSSDHGKYHQQIPVTLLDSTSQDLFFHISK